MYPFASIPGFISIYTYNNQQQRIEDILYYEIMKQSTVSCGIAGRVYYVFWVFRIQWQETPELPLLSAHVHGSIDGENISKN